jgi:UDP-3-O-[3-hydroxymyristoyl] N-acetylglucosamine deacetylase/3-hydroxyacyl-[acyl-carrier-protein] dehydratase
MNNFQQTIKNEISISGNGLHSGKSVTITLKPAPAGHGIKFQRIDLEGMPILDANCDWVSNSERSTTIEKNGIKLVTIEHLLSALHCAEIDNVLIETNNEEMPILDGSAKPFVDIIKTSGSVRQDAVRDIFSLKSNIMIEDPETGSKIIAMPCDTFKVTVMVDYKSQIVGPQHATLESYEDFETEIAPCRTFVFFHELEKLYNAGLIKGGDVDNAIVMVDKMPTTAEVENLSKLFNRNDITVKSEGFLNNLELHFQNEPARHKLLDVIGDLTLVGMPIKAHIIATYPGHKINTDFAKLIKQKIKESKTQIVAPEYDANKTPIFDIHDIQKILPHRYPFLLVDKVIELTDEFVVGVKNVTANENFFPGHFPDNHVMPGVLQIEAMAQCGGMLALRSIEDTSQYDVYFLKIDKAKFKRKVVPGDTLIMKVELMSPIRRGIVEMKGTIFVGNSIATEAEMMATIIKKQKPENS